MLARRVCTTSYRLPILKLYTVIVLLETTAGRQAARVRAALMLCVSETFKQFYSSSQDTTETRSAASVSTLRLIHSNRK